MFAGIDSKTLPEKFVTTVRGTFGAAGERLLRELPRLVDDCARRWELELCDHFPNLSYNYVAPGKRRDGTLIVVKIGVPNNKELLTEMETLRLFDGHGMVRLLDAVPDMGALLLERITPGASLIDERDDVVATRIAAQVIKSLSRPAPVQHSFPTVAKWFEGFQRLRNRFDGACGPFPVELFYLAEKFSNELPASTAAEVLLHGDLHQDNILFSERLGWLAIDPKGVVGDACFEVVSFLRNPIKLFADSSLALKMSEQRLKIFSEALGFEIKRMTKWAVAQAMLSACWCLEDAAGDWEGDISCAEIFARLL